jgi:hypothetical protein
MSFRDRIAVYSENHSSSYLVKVLAATASSIFTTDPVIFFQVSQRFVLLEVCILLLSRQSDTLCCSHLGFPQPSIYILLLSRQSVTLCCSHVGFPQPSISLRTLLCVSCTKLPCACATVNIVS